MPPPPGPTFVPGGVDDFYMPEVVSPAPKRITPQVPQDLQDDLQRMELEAGAGGRAGWDNPSPFPSVKLDNVPPTDSEKEEILWNRRDQVLHSNNVAIQLAWARDALGWADIQKESANRTHTATRARGPRPASPKVEHEIRNDAFNIVNYLAQQEHPEALFMLGKWLEFGKFGYRADKEAAYEKYSRAAELGTARAYYRMGMLLEASQDMQGAKQHYHHGMELKDAAASYRMGMMSLLGQHGERKDYQLGLERILVAAEGADEDSPQGAYVYGMLIVRDLGDIVVPDDILPVNQVLARSYIERAAFLGFPKAQLKMGKAYELCQLGCDLKPAESLHYYALAAKQGVPEAALGVSRWFLFGQDGLFPKNEQLAYRFAQEAAYANLPTGEFAMGYYHEIGIFVPRDINSAREWYQRAADHGNQDAIDRLESLDQSKVLSKKDHETTTLGRIKSQHGSQRGKRPERLKRIADNMPTLSEGPSTPADPSGMAPPPLKGGLNSLSPRNSPHPSPRLDGGFGNPPRGSSLQGGRGGGGVPYPTDDGPPMGPPSRSQSAAPYPDDDVAGGGGGYGRPPMGNINNRPPYNSSQSTGNLGPGGRGGPPPGPYDQRPGSSYEQGQGPAPGGYGRGGYGGPGPDQYGRPPAGGSPYDQQQQQGLPSGPAPGGRRPQQLRDDAGPPRAGSAPPQQQQPAPAPAPQPAKPPAVQHSNTAPAKPSQGPATFEEMGIPQGKAESDCVVM
jgi:TPR repeat protein